MQSIIKNQLFRSGVIFLGVVLIMGFGIALIPSAGFAQLTEEKCALLTPEQLDGDNDGFLMAECPSYCGGLAPQRECDADDLNKYVNPNVEEGLCKDAAGNPTSCTGWLTQTAWSLGEKEYANCRDYYADSNPSSSGNTCTIRYGIPSSSLNPFFVCNEYLSQKKIEEFNAVPINNNQTGGANEAELSCPKPAGLVPCGKYSDDPTTPNIDESQPCGFCHFFLLFDRITDWIIWKIVPAVAILLLVIGGLAIATSRGNASQLSRGKDIIIWTLAGYAVIFVGWMVLNSFFTGIGIKTWTGFGGETGTVESIAGNTITVTDPDNPNWPDWSDDEWDGFAFTVTKSTRNPELEGVSRIITETKNSNQVVTNTWGDPFPRAGDKFKIGGWWQFACRTE